MKTFVKIFGGFAIQILIGLLTWFIFKRFLVTAGVIIAFWAVMFFLENKFDKFIKGKSKQTEKNRLTNHEKEVEKMAKDDISAMGHGQYRAVIKVDHAYI